MIKSILNRHRINGNALLGIGCGSVKVSIILRRMFLKSADLAGHFKSSANTEQIALPWLDSNLS